jgi:hypothetical protein
MNITLLTIQLKKKKRKEGKELRKVVKTEISLERINLRMLRSMRTRRYPLRNHGVSCANITNTIRWEKVN